MQTRRSRRAEPVEQAQLEPAVARQEVKKRPARTSEGIGNVQKRARTGKGGRVPNHRVVGQFIWIPAVR